MILFFHVDDGNGQCLCNVNFLSISAQRLSVPYKHSHQMGLDLAPSNSCIPIYGFPWQAGWNWIQTQYLAT